MFIRKFKAFKCKKCGRVENRKQSILFPKGWARIINQDGSDFFCSVCKIEPQTNY